MDAWFSYCHIPALPKEKLSYPNSPAEYNFIFWKDGDFGLCFEQVIIVSASYATLALVSALYAGLKHSPPRRKTPSYVFILRAVLTLFLLLNTVVQFIAAFWSLPLQPYSFIIAHVIEAFSWLTHIICLLILSKTALHSGFGPLPLNLAWSVTLLSSIIRFRTVIRYIQHPSSYYYKDNDSYPHGYMSKLVEITCFIQFGLQLMYLLTLPFPTRPVSGHEVEIGITKRGRIAQSTQYREASPLLSGVINEGVITADNVKGYGSLRMRWISRIEHTSEDRANIISLLFFWWLQPLLKRGSKGFIKSSDDLPWLPHSLRTEIIRNKFQNILHTLSTNRAPQPVTTNRSLRSLDRLSQYSSEHDISFIHSDPPSTAEETEHVLISSSNVLPNDSARTNNTHRPQRAFSLIRALNKAFGLHYYPLGLMKLASDCLGFAGPLLLHQLVAFIEDKNEPISHGYYYALGLFLSTLLCAILNAHFTYQVNKVGIKLRAALITEVFRKTISVDSVSMSKFSTGEVVNFMSTDTDRIVNFCQSFHQFWSLPFQIAVSLYLLYRQVGLAFLAGLIFSILLIPVNRWLAIKIGKLSTAMMSQKDKRVKVMSELLNGIRVIKFYAWERNFADKINVLRNLELQNLKGRKYLDALCVYFWATTPVLISILTFTTYAVMGHKLTAAKVFTSVALFNMLISPLNAFPWVLNGLVESWVSLKRVQAFLSTTEVGPRSYYLSGSLFRAVLGMSFNGEGSNELISITDGSFTWRREDEIIQNVDEQGPVEWLLDGINFSVRKGEFLGITGKVGSGKSSLLAAIMAEMRKKRGQIFVSDLNDGFALVSQESWIQHATVRDTILFGLPYDANKYNAVIYACALEPDLQLLSAGDMTEVGENGVTLSGGQKARLTLARAVYQDKEVYLLDDPVAAVDAHVATHLYTHCIMGLLRRKTRILCTHHTKFLQEADVVVVLDNGKINMTGSPAVVLPVYQGQILEKQRRRELIHNRKVSKGDIESNELNRSSKQSGDDEEEEEKGDDGVLVKEEEREEGVVKFSVYAAYWGAVGIVLSPVIFLSLFLMQASRNIGDWWLSYWVTHTHDGTSPNLTLTDFNITPSHYQFIKPVIDIVSASDNLGFYLGIYGGLALANSVFTLFRAFVYAYGGIRAAKLIHQKLLSAMFRAPVWFFDITPIGRIINRFSSDLYAIDDSLPFIMNILLAQLYGLTGTLVITCYGLPWFIVVLVPLAIFYYYIQKYYRRTSRELKRLSTVTLSPVYAHFQESIMGLITIRAMRATQRFIRENERILETNQRANYASYAIAQWLSLRLQMLGVAMVAGVSFIAVLEHHFDSVNPGLVGLAISYALSVTNLLSGAVTSFTETEKEMVSVERAMQYIKGAPVENNTGDQEPPQEWPSKGAIEFKSVVLRYREGLPPALKAVSFIIKPGEKIGVVGRTGAGKSSLLQALFRIVDPLTSGSILIDDIDISTVSLECLRSVMAIIPQDPFLFSGSVRDNLDPCSKCSDFDLWSVLERCHLRIAVQKLGGLDAEVHERGRAFSVGQRQLICLGRALLTNSKIICVDEATASVDLQTDAQIQQTIRSELVSSTVISIAHRIETILNCDRILVMDGGKIQEFDSPGVLLGDSKSLFTSLFNEHMSKNRKSL